MDSNAASSFIFNPSSFPSVYFQAKEDDNNSIIDLGLSLKTLQPEAYHPSGQNFAIGSVPGSLEGYEDTVDWPQLNPHLKNSSFVFPSGVTRDCDDEAEGVQSRERWVYIKVNMDGVVVGRKICLLDHGGYSSLALQLEDMFGRQSASGLRLFQEGSEFSLFYKDRDESWRNVGDVPWKEFVDCVKRLRIARRNEYVLPSSSGFT